MVSGTFGCRKSVLQREPVLNDLNSVNCFSTLHLSWHCSNTVPDLELWCVDTIKSSRQKKVFILILFSYLLLYVFGVEICEVNEISKSCFGALG